MIKYVIEHKKYKLRENLYRFSLRSININLPPQKQNSSFVFSLIYLYL